MTIMHFWETDDSDHRRQRMWSVDAPDDIGPSLGIGLGTPNGEIVAIEWNPDRSGTYTTDTGYREMFGPLHHEVDTVDPTSKASRAGAIADAAVVRWQQAWQVKP